MLNTVKAVTAGYISTCIISVLVVLCGKMQFSKQEEDIYNSLVNIKDKKGTQVKYELTRPRKKQNKRREDKEPSLNNVYSTVIDQQEPESVCLMVSERTLARLRRKGTR